ncbi:MAG: hypothetical protein CVT73_06805 [Alphaproteobacteria bacterium HGW-Alphaproteobacteria-12]|nr:MAG: hypothetical protein CVT73_06805 [Alphaproteobacteria bacterium HGW-Alphaproteobacteria-12]
MSMRPLTSLFRRFLTDRRGNFATIFALAAIPLVVAAGAAVDISRAYIVENRLKAALDAAGLAIGGETGKTQAELEAIAQAYFDANYPAGKLGVPGAVNVVQDGNTVNLVVSAELPTVLMGIAGINTLDIGASSQITRMGKKLEVALVLDNTGSMNSGGRLTVLKAAAKDLIDTVGSAAVSPGDVRIAIVPFTTDVNVGTTYKNESWLKWTWAHPDLCTTTGWGKNKKTTCVDTRTVSKSGWGGCVVDRDEDYDTSVSTPTSADATKFPANDDNIYNANCGLRPIVPLSTNWSTLKSEIDAMSAGGATNTTIGFVWGWQMLTDGALLSNAAAPNAAELEKVMIYLTDGDNTYYRQGIGICNGSSHCAGVDLRTAAVCSAIKDADITVYTVRLVSGNATLLRNCASDASKYYSVNTANELTDVFKSIAQALSNLRISK